MRENEVKKYLNSVIKAIDNCKLHKNKKAYIEFLCQTHYFVAHSVPLLKVAIRNTKNCEFIDRSLEHIKEENGHDKVALADLKKLGININEYPEWEWTKSFYRRQYSLIEVQGEYLLGYILALEGIAVNARKILTQLQQSYGMNTTRFARIHIEEDVDHLPKAIEQINGSIYRDEIYHNFRLTIEEYLDFIERLSLIEQDQTVA